MPVYLQIACVDTFGLLGASFKSTSLNEVGSLVIAEPSRREALMSWKSGAGILELVYLATCNRVELLYFAPESAAPSGSLERSARQLFGVAADFPLYHLTGERAVWHLFRVAASLDSMVVGEAQILGQVKAAFEEAKAAGFCGVRLEELFAWAFRTAKKVRRETALGEGAVSIANLIGDEVARSWRPELGGRIVLVGVGEMTIKLARFLADRGIKNLHFVNRTPERAAALAQPYGAGFQGLADFFASPPPVSIIVSATSAPEPIFTLQTVSPLLNGHSVLMVDLAVPKDIAADVETHPAVTVRRLEDFRAQAVKNRAARQRETARAEEIVESDVARFWEKFLQNAEQSHWRHASVFDLSL